MSGGLAVPEITVPETVSLWKARVRPFVEALIPHEIEAELNGGELPGDVLARHKLMAKELRLAWVDVPERHGGLALSRMAQAAIWEELGHVTNALSWVFSEPQLWMFEACGPEQIERYVLPLARGEKTECYAITEAESGSDVDGISTTARRDGDDYVIHGEKWYVTSANKADFFILQAKIAGGENDGAHALFFIDMALPGIELVRTPAFSHTFSAHHPIYRFNAVRVPAANRIGPEGDGMRHSYDWFRRERIMIAARCCGAATRLIAEAGAFAEARIVSGAPIADYQSIQFMLADSVTELHAARLMTYDAAAAEDNGEAPSRVHAKASMAKLYASEMACRVADRAVQIFGGRGYMRENVAERFFRELRVERIWEGTSEVQRLIIARGFRKRGLEGLLGRNEQSNGSK